MVARNGPSTPEKHLQALSNLVAYAASFKDVEHEVTPVRSGYRMTLINNLFLHDDVPMPSPS